MSAPPANHGSKPPATAAGTKAYQELYFSDMLNRPICTGKIKDRIGKLSDLVFRLGEPFPEAVGIYIEHGWGKPTEFVPWEKVQRIEDDAIFVAPPEGGAQYPPFVDQPGWLLLNEHLMGRTILDMDGRRTEVVNDVHLLASKGRMLLVHVDISFNGFLRKWGLKRLSLARDRFISWRYVQPLSLEDVGTSDTVSLSITRKQLQELPGEDLADALEEVSREEQQAIFAALDSEKAAEALSEAEPRAQRQLIANLRRERAQMVLSEMSIPQLADLFSVLPHHDVVKMTELLPRDTADRIRAILSEREVTARALMSVDFVSAPKEAKVGQVLQQIRTSKHEHDKIAYVYVVVPDTKMLIGVVDLRELVLAADDAALNELMASPVVAAEQDDTRDDVAELFARYHFRLLPVVDIHDVLLGIIRYKDIMSGLTTRAKA
ncbi:MAG TPA: CBS domain-containing protein [Phycisphaerae bacterium]|nr:CBS domain-containing protein [Phycisphaerae bacterium]